MHHTLQARAFAALVTSCLALTDAVAQTAGCAGDPPPGFAYSDRAMSRKAGEVYWDPEFTRTAGGRGFAALADDQRRIWLAEIDQVSGDFINQTGYQSLLGSDALQIFSETMQGPEFGSSVLGLRVYYSASVNGRDRTAVANPQSLTTQLIQLPNGVSSTIAVAREEPSAQLSSVLHFERAGNLTAAVVRNENSAYGPLVDFNGLNPRWVPGRNTLTYIRRVDTGAGVLSPEVVIHDLDLDQQQVLTADGVDKLLAHPYFAPELGGRLAVMVLAAGGTQLRLYAEPNPPRPDGRFEPYATLELPACSVERQMFSPEPLQGGQGLHGRSVFVVASAEGGDPPFVDRGAIWMFAVGNGGAFQRAWRVDDGAGAANPTRRGEPETHIGRDQVIIYYSDLKQSSPFELELRTTTAGLPTCAADLDRNGIYGTADLAIFDQAYAAGDLFVDYNLNGVLDSGDRSAFIERQRECQTYIFGDSFEAP